MLEREIYHHYQLYIDQQVRIGGYHGFKAHDQYYIVVPLINVNQQKLQEMQSMVTYLYERGEKDQPRWVANQRGKYNSRVEGQEVLLVELPKFEREEKGSIGEQLGQFHRAGEQYSSINPELLRYNEWVSLWTTRLDQLKERYKTIAQNKPQSEFESLFLESFPYYEGLTENSIQYIVDYEWDRKGKEEGSYTITHERFHSASWIPVKQDSNLFVKLPLTWVIDHPVRDVSEYVRFLVTQKAKGDEISTFLNDYTKVKPITRGGWRLLYGRLLYPATYLDTVDSYFSSIRGQNRDDMLNSLKYVLSLEENHESFMKNFFNISALKRDVVNIEPVGWLTKSY